jgi:hypothetical protein
MTALARGFTLVLAFATGAAMGFVLTFTHRQYLLELGPVTVPLGLIGGLAVVAALLAGMRLAFGERLSPAVAAAGVVLGAAVLVLPGNSGSLYLESDPLGYVWVLGPTVLGIVIVGWPGSPGEAPRRRSGDTGDAPRPWFTP